MSLEDNDITNDVDKGICTLYYRIAGLHVKISSKDYCEDDIDALLPSYITFKSESPEEGNVFLSILIDNELKPYEGENLKTIGVFDTNDSKTAVCEYGGSYQFIIKTNYNSCCLLQVNADSLFCKCALRGNTHIRGNGLNNAIMIAFAYVGSFNKTLLIHASLIRRGEYGYAFIAKSGTGKSTHTGLWIQNIAGCDLMNDDNPVVRIIDGECYIYGSPWSGKTPCYRDTIARLGAITRIERSQYNIAERLQPLSAFSAILASCSTVKWNKAVFDGTCNTVAELTGKTAVFNLKCTASKEAALICYQAISR